MRRLRIGFVALVTVVLLASTAVAVAGDGKHPGWHGDSHHYTAAKVTNSITGEVSKKLVREKSPNAVLAQHMKALNACDWKGLMAQYPDQYQLRGGGVALTSGRVGPSGAGAVFEAFGKGGSMCWIHFAEVNRQKIDGTISVTWVATGTNPATGKTLQPYYGSDAYITDDGLMVSMVSTFDGNALKYNP